MRYLMTISFDPATVPATGPDPAMMEDMGKLIGEMAKAGVLLDTAGLKPLSEGTRVVYSGGKQTVIDGPFIEAKEVIGGYCIVQTKTQAEAVEWTQRFVAIHGPEWEITCEVRQIEEPA